MFKRLLPITTIIAVLSMPMPIYAQGPGGVAIYEMEQEFSQLNNAMQSLGKYVRNLGGYLGYNVTEAPSSINSSLIENVNQQQLAYGLTISVLVGALPVDSLVKNLAPGSIAGMNVFNNYANAVFTNPTFNTPKSQDGAVTVNTLINQSDYQKDPTSQAILNLISTPNDSYCVSYDGRTYNSDCKLLTQGLVAINAIGELPNPQAFFAYDTVKSQLPQLNLNSLTGPLLYNIKSQNISPTSSPLPESDQGKGLQTLSQAQAAQNFVRNASGSLLRLTLPSQQVYDPLYAKAMNLSKSTSLLDQKSAQKALSQYFAQVRQYVARMSIGISNLNYSMAKRLPQNPANAENPTSQALSEFQMATNRLFNAGVRSNNSQWIQKINTASSATVQKEMAILLAEINYQLYLNRQMQERLLLTNSVILFNSMNQAKPNPAILTTPSDS